MGCEFEFGYTAGLLLGRAEAAGRGAIRDVVDLEGGAIRCVVAAWWRLGGGAVF